MSPPGLSVWVDRKMNTVLQAANNMYTHEATEKVMQTPREVCASVLLHM